VVSPASPCSPTRLGFGDQNESANPDAEIIAAIRPAMATVPGAMFLAASSPYACRGELYQAYRQHHGHDHTPVLVWQAATRVMNPTVPQRLIDEETRPRLGPSTWRNSDPTSRASSAARSSMPRSCRAATSCRSSPTSPIAALSNPSGGSVDAMTLAIAHRDRSGTAILDLVRERRPPFSPEQVAAEFAGTLKAYGVHRVVGDHYAGAWPREQFAKHGVRYETSDRSKSEIYLESLPLLNSGKVELLAITRGSQLSSAVWSGALRAAAKTASTTRPVGTTTSATRRSVRCCWRHERRRR
jgi:hypothetical protein